MAITLITGTPGAGKTALAVSQLLDLVDAAQKGKPLRPIVTMGIPELTLPHEVAGPVETWTRAEPTAEDESVIESVFTFPEGALVIIDEAQKVYRPRSVGAKVPPHVAAFEKHRHRGLDFWLITQHPNLLDGNIRRLVGKHLHVRGHWAGRELLEWPEAANPDSRSDRAMAVRRKYRLPKRAFSLYKSASLHVKQKRRIPIQFFIFAAVVAVVLALGVRMAGRWNAVMDGTSAYSSQADLQTKGPKAEGKVVAAEGASRATVNAGTGLSMAAFVPRLQGRPESAPIYDELRKVVALPTVAGCMMRAKRCTCVTEQGTDAGYSFDECRAWLENPPFQPFRAVYPASAPVTTSAGR